MFASWRGEVLAATGFARLGYHGERIRSGREGIIVNCPVDGTSVNLPPVYHYSTDASRGTLPRLLDSSIVFADRSILRFRRRRTSVGNSLTETSPPPSQWK